MNLNLIRQIKIAAATVAAICVAYSAGFIVGRLKPKAVAVKTPPPVVAILHPDGSQTLARVNTPPPPPLPEPAGVVRRDRVTVLHITSAPEKSDIQVDTVTMKDGTQRVTAKGPALEGGQDFSVEIRTPPVHKWTLGGGISPQRYTILGGRSYGRIDTGLMIQRDRFDRRDWDVGVYAVFRF